MYFTPKEISETKDVVSAIFLTNSLGKLLYYNSNYFIIMLTNYYIIIVGSVLHQEFWKICLKISISDWSIGLTSTSVNLKSLTIQVE